MVTKRIRSEYMKRFKDPKWESYTKCYEEMLKYRLTRRLLEHTHRPWFWSGTDSDSDSGGRSPASPSKNQIQSEAGREQSGAELEECEGARMEQQSRAPLGSGPTIPLQEEEDNVSARQAAVHGSQLGGVLESGEAGEELALREPDKVERDTGGLRPQPSKPSKSSKQTWRSQRVRPAATQQLRDDSKESRHPFALYGSGEKDADMASRKTHNVGPAASTTEIYESALRAKTRREVDRQIQTQRSERRRAKSADLDKARKLVQPEFNPWLTEYMRCFSARSR
ncbi:centriole, cilia and spindle-associated protein isoform X1 [Centropristis striata]|uniref:centriole, cilia and spindle-associated protein isoform X1 n=1 Tax=Centropristis striata TaxID=184440 RepID=UPI0027E1B22D|nr:centriole, cilia and spindle-associated protein isoform X1 [Centropristis striata]